MAHYADKRDVPRFVLLGNQADNTDFGAFVVPANREVTFFDVKYIICGNSPTASAKVELCDTSDNVWASADITGALGTGSFTPSATYMGSAFPCKISSNASDRILKVRTDKASGTGCEVTVEIHKSYDGA